MAVEHKDLDNVSDDALQRQKLLAEVKKLRGENRLLDHPLRGAATYVSILIALASLASLWIQYQTNTFKSEKLAFEATQAVAEAEDALERAQTQLRQHQIRLLRNVVSNLDSTLVAVRTYSRANWRQVSVMRDGNKAIEELLLLSLNMGLLPEVLQDDLRALQDHYGEWLDEYAERFPDGIPRPHTELVFVQSFPGQAEANIRRCLEDLESGAGDCRA